MKEALAAAHITWPAQSEGMWRSLEEMLQNETQFFSCFTHPFSAATTIVSLNGLVHDQMEWVRTISLPLRAIAGAMVSAGKIEIPIAQVSASHPFVCFPLSALLAKLGI